jgi:hypothetical protein
VDTECRSWAMGVKRRERQQHVWTLNVAPNSLQPATRPRSPMTGDPLRGKDLLPLPLMVDPEWRVRREETSLSLRVCVCERGVSAGSCAQ